MRRTSSAPALTALAYWDRPPNPPDELRREHDAGHAANTCVFRPRSLDGVLLGTLLRDSREQCTDLGLPVTPVPPQRADGC
jgi:hypothetical protein